MSNPVRLLAIAIVAIAATANAQPVTGDIIFSTTSGLYYASPSLARLGTITRLPVANRGLIMDPGNRSLITGHVNGELLRVDATGQITTIATIGTGQTPCMALDQDGTLLRSSGTSITKVHHTGSPVVATWNYSTGITAICRDGISGDFLALTSRWDLRRIDARTGADTMLKNDFNHGAPRGLAFMPDSGNVAVTLANASLPLLILDTNGNVLRRVSFGFAGNQPTGECVTYHSATETLYFGTDPGQMIRTANDGTVINLAGFTAGIILDADVWGDHHVALTTTGLPGSTVNISLTFPDDRSRAYWVALSLKQRPGIEFPFAGKLHLAPDALFLASLSGGLGGFARNFQGTTNGFTGTASATFTLPGGLPSGMRIYCSAVVYSEYAPGYFRLGNTETIVVR